MTISIKNNEFKLIQATKVSKFKVITNAIEKAEFIREHKQDTYKLHNCGYLAEEYTYTVIDNETGFCLNRNPITFNECEALIMMYL